MHRGTAVLSLIPRTHIKGKGEKLMSGAALSQYDSLWAFSPCLLSQSTCHLNITWKHILGLHKPWILQGHLANSPTWADRNCIYRRHEPSRYFNSKKKKKSWVQELIHQQKEQPDVQLSSFWTVTQETPWKQQRDITQMLWTTHLQEALILVSLIIF